jgi:hypothetical protein
MIKLPFNVWFEQAVYGSFGFWRRGYAVLSQSAGCRPEWLTEMRSVCQRCGEPPAGAVVADSLFALRLKCGPWMIAGVYPQGCDDQGRPGAFAFHALFASPWAYRWAGANPFAFESVLRRDWIGADQNRALPAINLPIHATSKAASRTVSADDDPRLAPIVRALTDGRRAVVQSSAPIEPLARSVWRTLPRGVRRRVAVATWAFDNANDFDLVGLPKLAGVTRDRSALIFPAEPAYL